ncbi:MarR family transcriptional regulator [Idiomarina tyrosinivorans]|uniref:MarR family transcriptional regulator n=1 Tax=Idiomarina tyrosinivorans TaxID=1445662 RepID=A0A432ZQD7_9GAMM|nr:MarR family transcriptional regulator [Idiomarina tyrosinivorans]RUO80155.1 MarR family transcriptional regulator [Idiomarina tyrosinivorans]
MSPTDDLLKQLSVAERLARVARVWQRVVDQELEPLGLTHPRWSALWKLARLGDGISQKQLAQALEIQLASLMRTLSQLEQQGLTERRDCADDKRAKQVYLTPAGRELVASMETRILAVRRALLNDISDEQLSTVREVLHSICVNAKAFEVAQQGGQDER